MHCHRNRPPPQGEVDLVGCSQCRLNGACRLPGPLDLALDAFFNVLSRYTLADVLGTGRN